MARKVKVDPVAKYMPFLVEIRRRLLFLGALFLTSSAVGFIYYEKIITFLLKLFKFEGINIVFTSQFQFINLALNASIIVGLVIILPVIVYQILAFLKPALSTQEFKMIRFLLPFSFVLFAVGFTYGMMMMRSTLELFHSQARNLGVGNILDISTFLSETLITSALLGLAFEFPMVLTVLLRLKVVDNKWLASQRPIFYIIAMVFVVFLPPPDILSDVVLFLPLAILFELTLILNKLTQRLT